MTPHELSKQNWTVVGEEHMLALFLVDDPFWFRPLLWVVSHLPEGPAVYLTQRVDHWQTNRAVRLYRERKGQQ